jgi:hypothetical protein
LSVLLGAALVCAGQPVARRLAHAAQQPDQPPPRIRRQARPTPTPVNPNATGQNPDSTPTPTPRPTPTPDSGGGGGAKTGLIIGGIAAGAVLGTLIATHGDSGAKKLSKSGPQFEKRFDMSHFMVQGFVRGNWPVVVAYELPEPAVVTFSVMADKGARFDQQLDGAPGAHEIVLRLPATFADKPRPAVYALTAVTDDPNAPGEPVPLQLLGLGAGYNAVGSVGIDQINFQPGRVRASQSQQADYSFHSLFDFYKVSADFMRITRGAQRQLVAERVSSVTYDRGIGRGAQLSGRWDCRAGKRVSQGAHQLHVRAWRSLDDGGDWVAGVSRQSIFVD